MLRMAQTSAEADVGEVATPRKGRLSGCKRPHSESALPELKPFHPCSLPLQGRAAVAAEHSTESSAAQQEQERLTGVFQRFLASSSIVEPDESCADVGLKDQGFAQVLLARFYSSESGVRETAGTAPLRWRVRPHRRH